MILFPLLIAGVVETGGKSASSVVDTGDNMSLVSLILAANLPPVYGINDTSGTARWQNLPPVSLISVAHLDFRISL